MFTWICPHCGAEVPPTESECPHCSARGRPSDQPAPQPTEVAPPPAAVTPPSPPAQPVYVISEKRRVPGWVVALVVAAVTLGAGALGYRYLQSSHRASRPASPPEAAQLPGQVTGSRLAKYIEVTGFRILEDEQRRLQIQFLVVNHSPADIQDLAGKVRLRSSTGRPDEPPVGTFEFHTSRLAPYASIEFKTLLQSKLRAYEIPDWQFLRAEVEIVSPKEL